MLKIIKDILMIRFFDLSRQNKLLRKELKAAMAEVVKKGNFILGEKVEEFERAFADYLGVRYAVGVASGTDALSLALLAVGVEKEDEVILPANCYPTAFAITAIGAIPKLVDINPKTYTLDPEKIPQALTKKTKAIIPVHLYGQPADLGSIIRIIRLTRRKIYVIEDCAQAHGAEIQRENPKDKKQKVWEKVGSIGDIGCFSFYPTKNLGCFGDGGMVVTNNPEIYKKLKLLRMYGEEKRYWSLMLGRNSRLDELQAAILLVKLKYLDKWNSQRQKIANSYFSLFDKKKGRLKEDFLISLTSGNRECLYHLVSEIKENLQRQITFPIEVSYARHIYHLFVIRSPKRNQLREYLKKKGIETVIHYPFPIHLEPSFRFLGYKKGDFPESEKACEEVLSLPMYPELKEEEIKIVGEAIFQFFVRA